MKLLDNPKVRQHFADALADTDVYLPLRSSDEEPGLILDHRGEIFLYVDDAFAPESAARLASMVALAINNYAQAVNGEMVEVAP